MIPSLTLFLACHSVMHHTVPAPLADPDPIGAVHRGDGFTRLDVRFPCSDQSCAGWLYLPDDGPLGDPPPVVAMAHGFAGQREVGLPNVAEAFAGAGLAAFVFDYRYWGDSGGQPRYQVVAEAQVRDYHAAIAHLRHRDDVDGDRIAVWGTSFSGGHALLVARYNPHVVAAVAQVPMTNGAANGDLHVPWRRIWPLVRLSFMDKFRARQDRPRLYVKVMGGDGEVVFTPGPEAHGAVELVPATSDWPNVVAPDVLLDFDEFRPIRVADQIRIPTLFVVADRDLYVSNRATARTAERMPEAKVVHLDVGHFDVYSGPGLAAAVAPQIAFLHRLLAPSPTDGLAASP